MAKRLLPLIIIVLGIAGFMLLKASRPEPEAVTATERAWLVQVMPVEPALHVPFLPLYGELVAPEQVRITAPLAGQIARRPVREGQKVGRGDLLIAFDSADVQPQLKRAEAEVADFEAQLEAEKVRSDNDKKALTSEQTIFQNAQQQYQRTQSLVNRNLSSRENLDSAADALARARLTVTVRERAIAEHPSRLKSLDARLASARAALDTAGLNAARATVIAPFDGVVTGVQVAPGDQVNQNALLLSVYPVAGMELRASVPDRYRAELLSALDAGSRLEAESENGEHRFELIRFAGTSDASGTEAILSLQAGDMVGDDHGLRPGGLLPVMLQRPAVENTVAIPYSALYGSDSVYLMTAENRMQRIRVERLGEVPGPGGERQVLVASPDLKNGQSLIITHLPNAMSGLKVQLAGAGDGADE